MKKLLLFLFALPIVAQIITPTASVINVPQGGTTTIAYALSGATTAVGMQWDVQRSNPSLILAAPTIGAGAGSVNKVVSYNASRYMVYGINSSTQGVIPNGVLATALLTVPAATPIGPTTITVTTPLVQVDASGTGSTIMGGATLTINVTAVNTQTAVPNIVGQTQAAATSAITTVGLVVGIVTNANSNTVPQGSVISSNPAAGTLVNPGTAVSLVISLGPFVLTGDLNGDGVINAADLGIALNQALKISACTNGDVNKDGVCDVRDIVAIAKLVP